MQDLKKKRSPDHFMISQNKNAGLVKNLKTDIGALEQGEAFLSVGSYVVTSLESPWKKPLHKY